MTGTKLSHARSRSSLLIDEVLVTPMGMTDIELGYARSSLLSPIYSVDVQVLEMTGDSVSCICNVGYVLPICDRLKDVAYDRRRA